MRVSKVDHFTQEQVVTKQGQSVQLASSMWAVTHLISLLCCAAAREPVTESWCHVVAIRIIRNYCLRNLLGQTQNRPKCQVLVWPNMKSFLLFRTSSGTVNPDLVQVGSAV